MRGGKDREKDIIRRRDFLKIAGLCGGAMALSEWNNIPLSFAAEPYPSRKITWIVGHAPGGGEDMIPRGVAWY